MTRQDARDLLDTARDGAIMPRREMIPRLIETGDLRLCKPRGNSSKGLHGILTMDDLKGRCWIEEETKCWHWRGAIDGGGRPAIWMPVLKSVSSAGAAICWLKTGERSAHGRVWFVTCTTPHCCNPAHREEGSRSDMMKAPSVKQFDALHTQRVAQGLRARSKNCSEKIAEVIRTSTETLDVLAARYGMHRGTVWKIRRGKLWKPVAATGSIFSWGGIAA